MSKSLLKRTPLLPSALSAQASRGLLGIPQNRLMVKAEAMSGGGGGHTQEEAEKPSPVEGCLRQPRNSTRSCGGIATKLSLTGQRIVSEHS